MKERKFNFLLTEFMHVPKQYCFGKPESFVAIPVKDGLFHTNRVYGCCNDIGISLWTRNMYDLRQDFIDQIREIVFSSSEIVLQFQRSEYIIELQLYKPKLN